MSKIRYQGKLRTEVEHLRSGQKFITDAPVDNNGRGEAISPTDMVASALASCMLTMMGIKANSMDFDLVEASAEVAKVMESNPRRIGELQVKISLKQNCDDRTRKILEETALNCPVAKSLSEKVSQKIEFIWT